VNNTVCNLSEKICRSMFGAGVACRFRCHLVVIREKRGGDPFDPDIQQVDPRIEII
jgi:hypothetical protein